MNTEFEKELDLLLTDGLKTNPLRLEYETKVHELAVLRDQLLDDGHSVEETAKLLHERRRQLGHEYKKAAPPLFCEYIYDMTEKKYGDPLGPSYEVLRKRKTPEQIMESASRPIQDLNNRLTVDGFREWYEKRQFLSELVFSQAGPGDADAILALYKSLVGTEFCAWTENYPSMETIDFDLSRNALFCLKTRTGHELAGVISFDEDPETDALSCWSDAPAQSVEFSRLGVSPHYQGCGISGKLFSCAMQEAKKRGFHTARYLVAKTNEKALHAYKKQRFQTVGECVYHGIDYWCCEKTL